MTNFRTDARIAGVDLGGTKVRAGIADGSGRMLAALRAPTAVGGGVALVPQVAQLVGKLVSRTGSRMDALMAVGVGGAGVPYARGFELAPNLGDFGDLELGDELEERLSCPVVLENDVNVAALGELAAGVGRHTDTFAYIAVGTGIGMGLVINGTLVRGAQHAAGEIGYLPIGADPLSAPNQRRGPLEEVVAGEAIGKRYRPGTSARRVFQLAKSGDSAAQASLDQEAKWIAHALIAVEAVVNPGRYVLGGGIGSRPELLPRIHHWLGRLGRPRLNVAITSLGHDAPVIGAVQLAREHILMNQRGVLR